MKKRVIGFLLVVSLMVTACGSPVADSKDADFSEEMAEPADGTETQEVPNTGDEGVSPDCGPWDSSTNIVTYEVLDNNNLNP